MNARASTARSGGIPSTRTVALRARRRVPDAGAPIAMLNAAWRAARRAADRRTRTRRGHRTEELTPPLPGQRADVSLHSLEPGAATGTAGDPPLHEPGARETAVVLAGSVTLLIDDERHDLDAGDSVTFDADLPHHFENRGRTAAKFFAVVAAGLRRG